MQNGETQVEVKKPSRTTQWRKAKRAMAETKAEMPETPVETAETPPPEPETAPKPTAEQLVQYYEQVFAGMAPYVLQAQQAGISVVLLFELFTQLDQLLRADFTKGVESLCDLYQHSPFELGDLVSKHRQYAPQMWADGLGHDPYPMVAPEPVRPAQVAPPPIQLPPEPVRPPVSAPAPPTVTPELEAEVYQLREELASMRNQYRIGENRYIVKKSQTAAKHVLGPPRENPNPPRREESGPGEAWLTTVQKAVDKQRG